MAILKLGMAGEPVKILQKKLGVAADGQFGLATEQALKAFQANHGLAPDGIAGPDTFLALELPELILLAEGSRGAAVRKLQGALGLTADGQFDARTTAAVKAFQARHRLDVDGMAGPVTLSHMLVFAPLVPPAAVARSLEGPERAGAPLPQSAGLEEAPRRSIWRTLTNLFS